MTVVPTSEPRIAASAPRLANYIAGRWVPPTAAETTISRSPADGTPIAHVPMSGTGEVKSAVAAARSALARWSATSPTVRSRALFALHGALDAQKEELAKLITLDMGKTLSDARAEVGRGLESVQAACGAPWLLKGETLPGVASGVDVSLIRQPVGVTVGITPFNFPAMIPLWFLPFALACGNTFILKPSELVPLTADRIVQIIDETNALPPGAVNLLHGGRDAVNALLEHPDVDAVSFVGSATTARYIYRRAAESGKRVQALGGAKNAMILMPDAPPKETAAGVTSSAFGAAGQRCLAGSLAILVGTCQEQDRSSELIVDAARQLRTGNGSDPSTDVCPLVTSSARERVEDEIAHAVSEGARLLLDGRMGGGAGGAQLAPTIIDRAAPNSRVVTEELFGPVLTLVRAQTLDDALDVLNASRFGNAAVIFTASGGASREFQARAEAGMLGINVGVAAPVAWFPFAGWNDSFNGDLHANGRDAIDFYTRQKVVTERWA